MSKLYWYGNSGSVTFVEQGSPQNINEVVSIEITGIFNSDDVWDGGGNGTLFGTSNSDLITLDYTFLSLPSLIGITEIRSGDSADLVDFTSLRFTYGNVSIQGGSGDDWILTNDGNDILDGGAGNDRLKGYYGNDVLTGGIGKDELYGGNGNDTLIGGIGKDQLIGGMGKDVFDFNTLKETDVSKHTRDIITDFSHGQDKIDLSTLDANQAINGNQAFSTLVLGATFSGAFANLGDLYFDNVTHVLYGNTDTDSAAEFSIQLTGINTFTISDIIL